MLQKPTPPTLWQQRHLENRSVQKTLGQTSNKDQACHPSSGICFEHHQLVHLYVVNEGPLGNTTTTF